MIRIALIVLALCGAAVLAAHADMLMMGIGPGSFNSTPAVNCGTGVIDLSTGCPQPMLGGV